MLHQYMGVGLSPVGEGGCADNALVAAYCVDGRGEPLMPCGRCRQLLWENGGADCLLMTPEGVLPMSEVLPQAFGPENLAQR